MHYKAARGLLTMDFLIFSLGQGTRTTPKLAHSPNYDTTPMGGLGASTDHQLLYMVDLQVNDLELMTCSLELVTITTMLSGTEQRRSNEDSIYT
ncbi:hypothetical protein TNCV_836391 [Trichonephila clavipes]|nr:hypothetical protein TNCV_836391 [Trichonephila clavipes]